VALDGVGVECHTPAALCPERDCVQLYNRLGGPQGWSGQVWRSPAPTRIWTLNLPGLTNHYTVYAILALSYPSKVI